jgi:hypothetical protein
MPWTTDQKKLAAMAARDARLPDEHRKLILRQLGKRALLPGGEPSTTAPALTNTDFDVYMGLLESACGGALLHYSPGHWHDKAHDRWVRCRHKVRAMFRQACAVGLCYVPPELDEASALDRFLRARLATASDRNAGLEQAEWGELNALITIMHAMARKHGTKLEAA